MKILIVNPILYTNETKIIKKVNTIKDTMIYDLCLAFKDCGHAVTLAASDLYKPTDEESYPFEVVWMKTKCTNIFPPNVFPYCPEVSGMAKNTKYDLVITSEVFSLNSLMLAVSIPKKLIVWHELAKHNKIFHGYASRIWYGIIARLFFNKVLVVPRSKNAKDFISKYCKKVSNTIIDHGVNTDKFTPYTKKDNQFAISSQLIPRKHIEKSIKAFAQYVKTYNKGCRLYIMGDGEERDNLRALSDDLSIGENVVFTGKLQHTELIEILKKSMAMLIYTEKDNNMVSVVESIALATPIITTSVPYNSNYILSHKLGIVNDTWDEKDLNEIATNSEYINNCIDYRKYLPTDYKVSQFINVYNNEILKQ